MKWFFSKKRIDFCGVRSTTASASPKHSAAEESPLEPFAMARSRGPGSLYVGTKLCEASSDGSGEFLTSKPREALCLDLPTSPEEPLREEEDEDEAEETEVTLPATPCSIRSCPEPEQVLGFCPNCQSVVVPLTKKRPHIRTNPWLSGKRQRLQASRFSGGKSDGASVDALEAPQRQGTATSVTDSGIFDASPTNSALDPKPQASKGRVLCRQPAPPCDSSEEEETLRKPRRRRRRKKAPRRTTPDENLPPPLEGLCTPPQDFRLRRKPPPPQAGFCTPQSPPQDGFYTPQSLSQVGFCTPPQDFRLRRKPPPQDGFYTLQDGCLPQSDTRDDFCLPQSDTLDDFYLPESDTQDGFCLPQSPPQDRFCLPQSDTRDMWEVRGASEASEEAALDAEVRELSRRRVAAVRCGLQERIAQLRNDRQVLEQRLRAARDYRVVSGQREALWAREAGDYRKQLLLRLLSSAKGQVDRHLDRLQESYDALLAEKLAVEREARAQRSRGGGLSPEEMI